MTVTVTLTWQGTITARSSLAHGGDTRGTITLLRRELIVGPGGAAVPVPLISGNSFRGVLRRTGETMLREILDYDGQLPLSAVHALRGGGALAKTSAEPLSGQRLADLRALIPQVGVFGCAAGGRIIDGCLQVGKVLPNVAECAALHPVPLPPPAPPATRATQIETYARRDDAGSHDFTVAAAGSDSGDAGMLMQYRVETFPAGTVFSAWLRLTRATATEAAFFTDVLARFTAEGRLGGRAAIGHGLVDVRLPLAPGSPPVPAADWRAGLAARRGDALAALQALT
jgi:hypothetical protein